MEAVPVLARPASDGYRRKCRLQHPVTMMTIVDWYLARSHGGTSTPSLLIPTPLWQENATRLARKAPSERETRQDGRLAQIRFDSQPGNA